MYLLKHLKLFSKMCTNLFVRNCSCAWENKSMTRCLHVSSAMEKKHTFQTEPADYDIVPASSIDRNIVLSFLRREFVADEPILRSVGISGTDFEEYMSMCLDEDLSFAALPKCGVAPLSASLNTISTPKDIGKLEKLANNTPLKGLQQLYTFLAFVNKESELWKQFGVSKIFDLHIIVTDKRFRGRGIASELVAESLNLAKEFGFPLAKMVCTSHYSALTAKRVGMKEAYSIRYSDYLSNNGRPIFNTPAPHKAAKIYVMNLSPLSSR